MDNHVPMLGSGSSSLKFCVFQRPDDNRRILEVSAAGRAGTPDEVGTIGALLMGPDGAFISGRDILMNGEVTAAYWFGTLSRNN